MRPHRTAAPVTLVALPVLLLTGCGLGPATTFTEDVALTGDVRTVAVDSGSGDVTVRHDPAAAEPRLVRRVEYRGTAPGATTRQDGDRLALDGCPGSCSVDYELTLPDPDAAVTGVLGSGDAEISGVATVDLELGSGGTRLRDVTGPVTLDVGSGDVRGEGLSGDADVGSSSGTVRLAFAVPASARVRRAAATWRSPSRARTTRWPRRPARARCATASAPHPARRTPSTSAPAAATSCSASAGDAAPRPGQVEGRSPRSGPSSSRA